MLDEVLLKEVLQPCGDYFPPFYKQSLSDEGRGVATVLAQT